MNNQDPTLVLALTSALSDALRAEFDALTSFLTARVAAGESWEHALAAYPWGALAATAHDRAVLAALARAYQAGTGTASVQIGVAFNRRDERALAYARDRAAELVGRRRDGAQLVPNPRAQWAVTDTLRDEVKNLITGTLETPGTSWRALKDALRAQPGWSNTFGEYRAEMIARTEIALAANAGTCALFAEWGLAHVRVMDNPECPVCGPVAGTVQTLAWAKANPIGHPHCVRAFLAVTRTEAAALGLA